MNKNHIVIQRTTRETGTNTQTDGLLIVADQEQKPIFCCVTTELPWKDNTKRISHIMAGTYIGKKHNSPKFGACIWIQGVPGRSEILIHPANYVEQLLGCIAPGTFKMDVDGDGKVDDSSSSRNTVKNILKFLPDEFPVLIQDRETDDPLCKG